MFGAVGWLWLHARRENGGALGDGPTWATNFVGALAMLIVAAGFARRAGDDFGTWIATYLIVVGVWYAVVSLGALTVLDGEN